MNSNGGRLRACLNNGQIIRDAFAAGDIETIEALHHPEVTKAFSYDEVLIGREEVISGLKETLTDFSLEFIENEVESILISNDLAIEQTKFTIRVTPKNGGESSPYIGRTMVTYIRHEDNPTGGVTIREIIQPATD